MFSEKENSSKKIIEFVGWIGSYFLFSTILYFALKFLKKLPDTWDYFSILILTASIILVGGFLRKIIK